ncbi:MAG: gliding motility-associated C-terminal domain-containing protein [Bacteroidetes bacterium]|nr:gliding motility-associated C-terminal domain-containing protein [Bacteroidota bacterium]
MAQNIFCQRKFCFNKWSYTTTSISGCDSIITTNLNIISSYTTTIDAEICDGTDYILPDGTTTSIAGTYTTTLTSAFGCDSIITTNLNIISSYSTTVDAEICDGAEYILPDGSTTSIAGTYTTTLTSAFGCDSIITTNLNIISSYTTTVDAEICDGAEYILPDGSLVSISGTYSTTLTSISGCDSIITTNLNIISSYTTTVDAEICDGAEYILPDGTTTSIAGIYSTTLTSAFGCDSIITTNLNIISSYTTTVDAEICDDAEYILPDGSTTSIAGTYTTTLTSAFGCDSIITTNLNIISSYSTTVDAEICDGADYILPDGTTTSIAGIYSTTLISVFGCDSIITTNLNIISSYTTTVDAEICDGADYILPDGTTTSIAGIYSTTLISVFGCDSIITTNLNIISSYSTTIDAEICDGADYILPDGTTTSIAGIYSTTLISVFGCDSIITTNLNIISSYSTTVDAEICDGADYILPDGTTTSTSGIYTTTLTSTFGCDSIITTNLNIISSYTTTIDAEICDGADYILPDGSTTSIAGTYTTTLTSAFGCDSIITTNLNIIAAYTTTIDAEICDGAEYILPDGTTVSTSGVYTTTLTSISGCDSIITTNLNIILSYTTTVDAEICDGAEYILPDGSSVSTSGVYTTTLTSAFGCDSIITTNLNIISSYTTTVDAEICDGADYILPDGSYVSTSGVYTTTLTSISGCDSIITTNLNIISSYTTTVDAEICDGAEYILPDGSSVSTSGIYTTTLSSAFGCDSIITTNLNIISSYTTTVDAEICDGADYILPDGTSVSTSGTYSTTLTSAFGCDSIITTNLNIISSYTTTVDAEICDGADYILPDGSSVSTSGIYTTTLTSAFGCDSIITTNLIVNTIYESFIDTIICEGEVYLLPDGATATIAGSYFSNLVSVSGCDSIITTNLGVNSSFATIVDTVICEGDLYTLPDGSSATISGTYISNLISMKGCDSIITTNLIVNPTYSTTVVATICEGDIYTLPDGVIVSDAGDYTSTFISISGCDSIITTHLNLNIIPTTFGSVSICEGDTFIMPDGSVDSVAGVYEFTFESIAGCDSIVSITLNVNPLPAVNFSGLDDEYCINDSSSILFPVPSGGTFSGPGITDNIFDPAFAGVGGPYTIEYDFVNGSGCSNTIYKNTFVNALPLVGLNSPTQLCLEADPIELTFSPAGGVLSGEGISGEYFTPSVAGTGGPYTINYTYTDSNGCVATDNQFIVVTENVVDAGEDQSLIIGDSVYLQAYPAGSVIWSPAIGVDCVDCTGTFVFPIETTNYFVTSTDDNGCIAIDDVTVYVTYDPDETIFAPSAFTPNGDGKNDHFFIYGPDILYIESLQVFDRWGKLIFSATHVPADVIDKGWDGTFQGQYLNTGVYAWTAEIILKGNIRINRAGNVTLLK